MRKTAFFLAAAAAAICTVACNKELPGQAGSDNNPDVAAATSAIRLAIKGDGGDVITKAWEEDFDDKHSAVANIQFFVFDGEVLDVYKKITSGTSVDLTVKTGSKTVWAVVNAPDISTVKTVSELKAVKTTLLDNASNFVMVGNTTATVPTDDPITVEVKRIVSRVVVKKITADFSNPAYSALSCNLQKIFLINAPGDTNLELTDTPTIWYAKRAYEAVPYLANHLATSFGNRDIKSEPYTTISRHYCYPNPISADSQATTWSARHTRIVLELKLGDETFYYPVTLPVLEPGKSYEIDNLTITRKGSTDPDQPVSLSDATFEIKVKDWTVVPVTEGITI